MAFRNSILAATVLLREAIRSPNFVSGSAGWSIDQDGSAEFNDVVIRGGTVVSGLALYYNGPPALGNLILSIAAQAGTDVYGNAYLQGLGVYGSDGVVQANGSELTVTGSNGSAVNILTGGGQATLDLVPPELVGANWGSASLFTTLGALDRPGVALSSPNEDSNTRTSSMEFFGGGPTTSDTSILVDADQVSLSKNLAVAEVLTAGNVRSGTAATPAPGVGGGTSTVAVVFATAMTATPRVTIDPVTTVDPGTVTIRGYVDSVTTAGFTIRAFRSTNSLTNWSYTALSA